MFANVPFGRSRAGVQEETLQSAAHGLEWLKELGNSLLDFLFPPHCVHCQRPGAWICTECLDAIELIEPPVCHHCGLPVYSHGRGQPVKRDASEYACTGCTFNPLGLEGLRYAAFYGEVLRLAVGQFKYKDLWVLAGPLGRLMADRWECLRPGDSEPDVIVPVALHPQRERARGYNQAALLVDELGCQLGLPAVSGALVRVRDTMPQVGLSSHERRENVRGAFSCRGSTLSGSRVLLVDDVCTTGSTLEAAASALLDGGVESVWAYTLARPNGG